MVVLENETVIIENDILLIGRHDSSFARIYEEPSLTELLDHQDTSLFSIVMDHDPKRIDESIYQDVDMQVSGHTHNGQLFPINWITDFLFKLGYGYEQFNNTHVIVTGGIGSWGPLMRTSSQSEIVCIHILSIK